MNFPAPSQVLLYALAIAAGLVYFPYIFVAYARITNNYDMPVVMFNSTGVVQTPSTGNLWIFIYEGFYGGNATAGADVFTRARGQGEASDLFERISFARYTGRAQLDITSI